MTGLRIFRAGGKAALAACLAGALWTALAAPVLAATEEQLRAAFAAADVNADGVVDVDEYVAYFADAFRRRDADGDGFLVPADFPNPDMARFGEADRDGDGRISLGEAVAERMLVFFDLASDDGVIRLDELLAYEAAR
ncbi:MAG: hypothetical protein ACFCUS_04950 [Rubrimonas sp.]|uniref:hypothetical protein n=1 Tax=Rubrimonas sp. TaxID=2036015 RepID=UPI002FDE88B7